MARSVKMQLYKQSPDLFDDASSHFVEEMYKYISINGGPTGERYVINVKLIIGT